MDNEFDLERVNTYLENKLRSNDDKIICTYYEMKFELNISEKDENTFLKIARDKFQKNGYDVYFTNAKYKYCNEVKTVGSNEMIIAIKEFTN